MKKRDICKFIAVGVLAACLGGNAYAEDALARVKAAGVLKVGTETEFAPFDFIDSGEHVGLNVDLFAEIGKEMGVKIEWVALPWDGVLPGLEAGKFDVVAGPATITKARMEHYRFLPPHRRSLRCALEAQGRHVGHEAGRYRGQDRWRWQGDSPARPARSLQRDVADQGHGEGIRRL